MRDTGRVVIRMLSLINMLLSHFLGNCLLSNSPETHMTEDITLTAENLHENQNSFTVTQSVSQEPMTSYQAS